MREILFRGTTFKGEWVEGFYMTNSSGETFIQVKDAYLPKDVYPETVGQFTGLLDKNGKRIFEGDVVERTSKKFPRWHSQLYVISIEKGATVKRQPIGLIGTFVEYEAKESEVIGNIHDNPELLSERSGVSGRE